LTAHPIALTILLGVTTRSTHPIETHAYNLARKIKGWSFGVSPALEMIDGACHG
jgi:hypothetical protein